MKTVFVLCIFMFGFAACRNHGSSLVLPQGVWSASFRNADFATLTPDGVGAICRDRVPPECSEQVPNGVVNFTLSGSNFTQDYINLEGITTIEAAEEAFPACAAVGIYPTEFRFRVPNARVTSYNAATGHLQFIDSRRPDEFNCVRVNYRQSRGGPFITMRQRLTFRGTLEEVVTVGVRNSCDTETFCDIGFDSDNGILSLAFSNVFHLSCIAGACLD